MGRRSLTGLLALGLATGLLSLSPSTPATGAPTAPLPTCGDRVRANSLPEALYGDRCKVERSVSITRLTPDGQRFPLSYGGRYYYQYRISAPNHDWWVETNLYRSTAGGLKLVDRWSYESYGDPDWRYHNYVKPANLRPGVYGMVSYVYDRYTRTFVWEPDVDGGGGRYVPGRKDRIRDRDLAVFQVG